MSTAIILLAKNPVLGRVKTRLAKSVGEARALKIYLKLLDNIHHQITALKDVKKYVYFSDYADPTPKWFEAGFIVRQQVGNNLGARMKNALEEVLINHQHVILIGSDCGELTSETLQGALDALKNNDVVVGPTLDGGYYLIGMNAMYPLLFDDIVWSIPTVMRTTVGRIHALGLSYHLMPTLSDVDWIDDWEKLGWEE